MASVRCFLSVLFVSVVLVPMHVLGAHAFVTEHIQTELARKNQSNWLAEDQQIDDRLAVLKKKFGKRPNIIFILTDDIGWGELGSYGGGKLRGTPTPNLDAMAADGIKLLQHYSEPSCTPTRVALLTGRLPVRTGVDAVLFPGSSKGLVAEEYTIASLLSDAGYKTAMFGKWHVGEKPEHLPTNHGFDQAFYTVHNGAVWPWRENAQFYSPENEAIEGTPYFYGMPADFESRYGIDVGGIYESKRGADPVKIGELSLERYNVHDNELTDHVIDYINENAQSEKPFFAYYASSAEQVFGCPPLERAEKGVDQGNCQAAQLVQHDKNVRRILDTLEQQKIAENTLVIWVSDNGPMYSFYPSTGFTYLSGQKGGVEEGGIRTPAIVRWAGVVQPHQDPVDIVHVTDWYVTMARVAGAVDRIPQDRVVDGVDQSSLLLNGEGHSRRNYLYLYTYTGYKSFDTAGKGARLAALRLDNMKVMLGNGAVYNIQRDAQERINVRKQHLWAQNVFQKMVYEHQDLMRKYPNRVLVENGGSTVNEK